jgi:DNA-binding transcriptional ArsR family regulator
MQDSCTTPRGTADLSELTDVLALLTDRTRLSILLTLCVGESNVSDLCAALSVSQTLMSHHLGILRRAGLVVARRSGKYVFYCLHAKTHASCGVRVTLAGGAAVTITRDAGRA